MPLYSLPPPHSNPSSTSSSPLLIGKVLTFSATATDANNENYYLVVCGSDSVTSGTTGGAPACGGKQYCVSGSTASGSSASCTYTTKAADPWENPWFAFVCDNNSTVSACSPANQGSGDSGSPFFVNHPPVFTAVSNNSPQNPGGTVTWTATAYDPDGHTIYLRVWQNAFVYFCNGSFVASNPTCSYPVPIPTADGLYSPTGFSVYDQFGNFVYLDVDSDFVVNNVAPTVSNITLNGGADINLIEGTTTPVPITATVTDNNGCGSGEISSVQAYMATAYNGYFDSSCSSSSGANGSTCYPEIDCSVVAGSCTGLNDATANYTCTANLQYYAVATDDDYSGCYYHRTWKAAIKATDNNSASSGLIDMPSGVEVLTLAAFSIDPTYINYGSLLVGERNTILDKAIVTTPTGNTGIKHKFSGTKMCTDSPTCSITGKSPIAIDKQKYSLTENTAYSDGTALSATPTLVNINVPSVWDGLVITKTTYWGMEIPPGTLAGTYSGQNTIVAVPYRSSGGVCEKR